MTAKDGSTKSYTRPVIEVILLTSKKVFEKMKTSFVLETRTEPFNLGRYCFV